MTFFNLKFDSSAEEFFPLISFFADPSSKQRGGRTGQSPSCVFSQQLRSEKSSYPLSQAFTLIPLTSRGSLQPCDGMND